MSNSARPETATVKTKTATAHDATAFLISIFFVDGDDGRVADTALSGTLPRPRANGSDGRVGVFQSRMHTAGNSCRHCPTARHQPLCLIAKANVSENRTPIACFLVHAVS